MMKIYNIRTGAALLLFVAASALFFACKKETIYERTRLFRPVLNEELMAKDNTILVNLGNIREAVSYTVEVSRDTFASIDYTFESDTNYIVIDAAVLNGQSLLWNTLYQVRVTAHADESVYDSKSSDLGSVRTERFPTILNIPETSDVIDVAARVSWTVSGAAVTKIRTFAPNDLQLATPLGEFDVDQAAQAAGEFIVTGLTPNTEYQIAIYSGASGETLRGWETFKTLPPAVDLSDPNVINLTQSEDPDAVISAVAMATSGQIIVLKKGVQYNLPIDPLDKSITIIGAYGFGTQKATLFTTGNWNIADGATIDHIRFIDVEIRGEDIGGDYVFNPNNTNTTTVNELTFENCVISTVRGIIRIRAKVFVTNFNINNSIVHKIGGYGILTTDTDGEGNAAVDHLNLTNSTFSKVNSFLTSRQNMKSINISACTMNEIGSPDGIVLRFRGTAGLFSNVLNGVSITNSVWGHAWDEAMSGNLAVRFKYEGLEATNFTVVNTYATSDFAFTAGSEIPGFPSSTFNGKAEDLWEDPYMGLDFHFKASNFAGKYDSGDPRWRAEL